LYTTPLPKTRKDFKERAILPVAGVGSHMDWVPAREPTDWSFINCTFKYKWGTNGV
jgi:hypothetical protein